MAERLKARLLDSKRLADLVVGPDAYRDLPRILAAVHVSDYINQHVRNTSVDMTSVGT